MTHDIVYSSMIQSFTDDSVIISLVSYMLPIISREMLREIQGLKIENNVSIPGFG
jgi:hypothetical protein